jgi:plasmid maintenance system antidote protein VapI
MIKDHIRDIIYEDWLLNKKTCQQLAEKYGTTKRTISRILSEKIVLKK